MNYDKLKQSTLLDIFPLQRKSMNHKYDFGAKSH